MPDKQARQLARAAVHRLDAILRWRQRINEYSQANHCIFRIALRRNRDERTLDDGTHLYPDDLIGELHFWNERFSPNNGSEPDLIWARNLYRRAIQSLEDLAAHVQTAEPTQRVSALRGTVVVDDGQWLVWQHILQRLGFQIVNLPQPNIWGRTRQVGEDLLVWTLIWSVNPESLRGKGFHRQRLRCWMSRSELLARYATRPQATVSGTADPQDISPTTSRSEPQCGSFVPES